MADTVWDRGMNAATRQAITTALEYGRLFEDEIPWAERVIDQLGLDFFRTVLVMWDTYATLQKARAMMGIPLRDFCGLR
jgi:hypothetical protein